MPYKLHLAQMIDYFFRTFEMKLFNTFNIFLLTSKKGKSTTSQDFLSVYKALINNNFGTCTNIKHT